MNTDEISHNKTAIIYSYLVQLRVEPEEDLSDMCGDRQLVILHLPVEMSLDAVAEIARQYDMTLHDPEDPDVSGHNPRLSYSTHGDCTTQAWGPSTKDQDVTPFTVWTTETDAFIRLVLDMGWKWEGWCDFCNRQLDTSYGRVCDECDPGHGDPLQSAA